MKPIWQEILGRPDFLGYEFFQAPAPSTDLETVLKCRNLCRENTCGCYGTTWACPPGSCSDEEARDILNGYPDAIIVSRRLEYGEDYSALAQFSKEFQNVCRNISLAARCEGVKNLPLADGGCTYCDKCAYPEKCRYPDRKVISISGMGIDIGNYLEKQGISFKFEKGAATLYGLILFKDE